MTLFGVGAWSIPWPITQLRTRDFFPFERTATAVPWPSEELSNFTVSWSVLGDLAGFWCLWRWPLAMIVWDAQEMTCTEQMDRAAQKAARVLVGHIKQQMAGKQRIMKHEKPAKTPSESSSQRWRASHTMRRIVKKQLQPSDSPWGPPGLVLVATVTPLRNRSFSGWWFHIFSHFFCKRIPTIWSGDPQWQWPTWTNMTNIYIYIYIILHLFRNELKPPTSFPEPVWKKGSLDILFAMHVTGASKLSQVAPRKTQPFLSHR